MRIKKFLVKALRYLRDILLIDIAILLLVFLTFVITRNFTFLALSERLFWAGMLVTMVAGVVGLAAGFSGRSYGIPVIIRRPEEARRLLDHMDEYRAETEKRYDLGIWLFLIGLGCIAFSALVQVFLT